MVLGATPLQMGVLSAIGGASVLLFSLLAGVIVDRIRRRPVMIGADLGRAILLGFVPLLAVLHRLSMPQLIGIAAATGILTVLFDVAYQSYLPSIVAVEDLLEGNRLLSMSSATAEIVGASLTGLLVQLITAPIAIALDSVSFVVSGLSVWTIRGTERAPAPRPRAAGLREETFAGMRTILADSVLRVLLFRSVTAFFSMGAVFTFYILYAIRTLHVSPAALGLTIALGGLGSLGGGFVAGRVSARFGITRSFFFSALCGALVYLCLPLASLVPRYAVALLCVQQFVGDIAFTVFVVNETTLRQSVAQADVLGRVNATMQLASRGVLPIGALVSGYIGNTIGIANTLWISSAGLLLSTLWLAPFLRSNRLPDPQVH